MMKKSEKSIRRKSYSVRRVALGGIFTCAALILGYIEYLIPFNFGIPGVKLGLANLAVVAALYLSGVTLAVEVSVIRIVLSSLLFGNPVGFAYSLCGGFLSLCIMLILKYTGKFGIIGVSIAGGTLHNVGQLAVAAVIFDNFRIAFYLPVLLISGAVTGFLIGICAAFLCSRLEKHFTKVKK